MEPIAFGIRCCNKMVLVEDPMVLAAMTNSCCLRLKTCPRTTRAISTQYTVPRAMIILCKPDSRYTIIKITYKVSGMVLIISTIRIITVSTMPPA